jgi:hypothetical protein
MAKKITKKLTLLFGGFLVFLFKYTKIFAAGPVYGPPSQDEAPLPVYGPPNDSGALTSEPTALEKIISTILSPIFLLIISVLALFIGIFVYLKRKKKHVQEDS